MRLIFAGTPVFAAVALEALADAGHDIVLVLTQPDKPAGRGLKLSPSAVTLGAARRGLPIEKPVTLKDAMFQQHLAEFQADAMIVAAYGLILPPAVLALPRLGCINIHASLLPRWRGAAPVQRAIEAGDRETGITIMRMDAGLDTGPMLLQRTIPITEDDTSATLLDKLAHQGAKAVVDALGRFASLTPVPQPETGVTYAKKLLKNEAPIDWALPAQTLASRIRAFNPYPGAETSWNDVPLKIWKAAISVGEGSPGEVIQASAGELRVACGEGALSLLELQKPGGKHLPAADFLRGVELPAGMVFGK